MKQKFIAFAFVFSAVVAILFTQCTKHKKETIIEQVNTSCYPDDIGKIFVLKCATSGCHNTASKDAAAGLDLSSWDKLFNGSRGGAAVIPYSVDQSFLLYFINTFSDLGPIKIPTMPNNGTPLSREEVLSVINWINDGAPDCNGKRLTDNNPDQKKFYITNQGCDLVSVWDADRKVIMRYVKVGNDPNLIESPHKVGISPDGLHWYVSFTGANAKYFQKYRTSDDSFVGQANLWTGMSAGNSWNTFVFSPDSKLAYIPDYSSASTGRVAIVDCETMTLKATTFLNPFPSGSPYPHGSLMTPDGHYLYLTKQEGNGIYKIDLTGPVPDGFDINFPAGSSKPHEIAFSPDGTLYFVTCQASNNVLVYKASNDQYLKSISVGGYPQEMSFSNSTPYLFVSCMTGNAVSIINYQDTTFVKTISNAGFAFPHGIAVDDEHGLCYVLSRNVPGSGGPPPHHTSICGGVNGYMNAIDLNTLELVPGFKPELSVDPYSIAIKK